MDINFNDSDQVAEHAGYVKKTNRSRRADPPPSNSERNRHSNSSSSTNTSYRQRDEEQESYQPGNKVTIVSHPTGWEACIKGHTA
jgi:hypothetical protein